MSSSVARLHRALVDAMRRNRPNAPNGTVTVAEIYQDLVPYRSVRSALGFALNADYEHALLQLLAGVENRARIEPAEAREALRLELESPNPNTGVFRGYAACDVIIMPLDESQEPAPVVEPAEAAAAVGSPPAVGPQAVPVAEPVRAAAPAVPSTATRQQRTSMAAAAARATHCYACGQALPSDRAVRFCPHCGEDQQTRKCTACGEQLEAGWKYCVMCGEAVRR